jgi:hypothetical protein
MHAGGARVREDMPMAVAYTGRDTLTAKKRMPNVGSSMHIDGDKAHMHMPMAMTNTHQQCQAGHLPMAAAHAYRHAQGVCK